MNRKTWALLLSFFLLSAFTSEYVIAAENKKFIHVYNGNDMDLTDFQVELAVDTSTPISQGDMQSDCSDLEFFDPEDMSKIPHYIASGVNSSNTKVWIKVPFLPARSTVILSMTYGGSYGKVESSAEEVFEFFDSFDGETLDPNKWGARVNNGFRYYLDNGYLNIDMQGPSGRHISLNSNYFFEDSVVVESSSLIANSYGLTAQVGHAVLWYDGYLSVSAADTSSEEMFEFLYPRGFEIVTKEVYLSSPVKAKVCYADTCTGSFVTTAIFNDPNILGIAAYDHSNRTSSSDFFRVNWIRARKYAPVAPVAMVKDEVTAGSLSCDSLVADAYDAGYNDGDAAGFASGMEAGYAQGFSEGERVGYDQGFVTGRKAGYMLGHAEGVEEARDACLADPASCGIYPGYSGYNPSSGYLPPGQGKKAGTVEGGASSPRQRE